MFCQSRSFCRPEGILNNHKPVYNIWYISWFSKTVSGASIWAYNKWRIVLKQSVAIVIWDNACWIRNILDTNAMGNDPISNRSPCVQGPRRSWSTFYFCNVWLQIACQVSGFCIFACCAIFQNSLSLKTSRWETKGQWFVWQHLIYSTCVNNL